MSLVQSPPGYRTCIWIHFTFLSHHDHPENPAHFGPLDLSLPPDHPDLLDHPDYHTLLGPLDHPDHLLPTPHLVSQGGSTRLVTEVHTKVIVQLHPAVDITVDDEHHGALDGEEDEEVDGKDRRMVTMIRMAVPC